MDRVKAYVDGFNLPPKRHSSELGRVTDGVLRISDASVRQSRLPASVVSPAGILPETPELLDIDPVDPSLVECYGACQHHPGECS